MATYREWLAASGRHDDIASLDRLTAVRESGYTGPLAEDMTPAIRENTDAATREALQTPFRRPGNPRNPR